MTARLLADVSVSFGERLFLHLRTAVRYVIGSRYVIILQHQQLLGCYVHDTLYLALHILEENPSPC